MIRLVNRMTGGDMWVHESRLDEYLEAGHKLASPPIPEKKTAAKLAAKKSTVKR